MTTSGAISFSDAWKLTYDVVEGLANHRPPNLTGKANNFLTRFEHDGRPVSEGIST